MRRASLPFPPRCSPAFTLVEILTAVAITTIIVVALVSMLNTSTKALQAANRQIDTWETARSTFGILERDIGEVAIGGAAGRVNVYAANAGVNVVGGQDFRLQDVYVLSSEQNLWTVNVFLLGRDQKSELPNLPVRTLYRFQTNYSTATTFGAATLDIDQPFGTVNHTYSIALNALDRYLDDVAAGRPTDGTINVMAKGIVHLRLISYAADGRAFSNSASLNPVPVDHVISPNLLEFRGDLLPAALDLEMFVLDPDRMAEFRAQPAIGLIQMGYLNKHLNSIQLFRTRIPIRKDVLARQ